MANYFFKRYEYKYMLSREQYNGIIDEIRERMTPDEYGETTIQSLYFDTPDFRLVRMSNEKPVYKEKLRLRCYGLNDSDKDVFLEMKRKYDGVVYKRRVSFKEQDVKSLADIRADKSQIGRELAYFVDFYGGLEPKALIMYDRSAFFEKATQLRVTFDRNIRYRMNELNLHTSLSGAPIIPDDNVLMEVKAGDSIPLWFCDLLARFDVRKSSFSKYGTVYEQEFRRGNIR